MPTLIRDVAAATAPVMATPSQNPCGSRSGGRQRSSSHVQTTSNPISSARRARSRMFAHRDVAPPPNTSPIGRTRPISNGRIGPPWSTRAPSVGRDVAGDDPSWRQIAARASVGSLHGTDTGARRGGRAEPRRIGAWVSAESASPDLGEACPTRGRAPRSRHRSGHVRSLDRVRGARGRSRFRARDAERDPRDLERRAVQRFGVGWTHRDRRCGLPPRRHRRCHRASRDRSCPRVSRRDVERRDDGGSRGLGAPEPDRRCRAGRRHGCGRADLGATSSGPGPAAADPRHPRQISRHMREAERDAGCACSGDVRSFPT